MIRYIKLRLNLDKPEDAKAYGIIRNAEKSQSKFLIEAVNAYGKYLTAEEDKKAFLQTVRNTIRDTVRELFNGSLMLIQSSPQAEQISAKPSEESGEIADDFLKSLF